MSIKTSELIPLSQLRSLALQATKNVMTEITDQKNIEAERLRSILPKFHSIIDALTTKTTELSTAAVCVSILFSTLFLHDISFINRQT